MINIQIEMTIAATILLIFIISCLRKNSLSIKHSLAWLLLPIVFIIIAIFPAPIAALATWLGFETLSNFIFLAAIAMLVIIAFSLTTQISKQQSEITKLTQELSILKKVKNDQKSKK